MTGRVPALLAAPASTCADRDAAGPESPCEVWNRPGLPQIDYRIGAHADFKTTLLHRLSAAGHPALQALTTRDDADPVIALLDATAVLGDIITFYSERIANESWLATATERRSLVSLGRLTAYEPAAGLAATAWLAFTLEDAAGAPEETLVPGGTAIRSVPAAGQLPQTFETLGAFTGRPEWNAMRPVTTQPHPPLAADTGSLLLQGIATGIRPGDRLLLRQPDANWLKVAAAVHPDPATGTTRIDLEPAPAPWPPLALKLLPRGDFSRDLATIPATRLTAHVIDRIFATRWNHADLSAFIRSRRWSSVEARQAVNAKPASDAVATGMEVVRFRQRAAAFGHNAPPWATLKDKDGAPLYPVDWDSGAATALDRRWSVAGQVTGGGATSVELDHVYAGIGPGSLVVLEEDGRRHVVTVKSADEHGAVGFALSAKATRLDLGDAAGLAAFTRRGVAIHCDSEALTLARPPVPDAVEGQTLALDGLLLGLVAGQRIAVSGPRADLPGVVGAEIAEIAAVSLSGAVTVLSLRQPLALRYQRTTARINANVVAASHGELVDEMLGAGDAAVPFQAFVLAQGPVTWLADQTGGPPRSTLEVRVNGERWNEVETLFGQGARARVFITWRDDAGRTHVKFGDGRTGARLPTGLGAVTARYRKGVGTVGLVAPGALSMLLTRPLGVRSVANPVASAGAADPDPAEALRRAVPLGVMTLERAVSIADYAALALTWPGVVKARAVRIAAAGGPRVRVTAVGADGAAIATDDPLATGLLARLRAAGDPYVAVELGTYQPDYFQVEAALKLDPAAPADAVRAAAEAALRVCFAIEHRDFDQPVLHAEVTAMLQVTPGVLACAVTALRTLSREARDGALLPDTTAGVDRILLLDPRPIAFGDLP